MLAFGEAMWWRPDGGGTLPSTRFGGRGGDRLPTVRSTTAAALLLSAPHLPPPNLPLAIGHSKLAKERAENNHDTRVLLALSEMTLVCFSTPDESKIVGHGLFGDGAGVIILGTDSLTDGEHPLFEMVAALHTMIPGTKHALSM
uniref:Chalcone/stilbene synthase N-terminal domain-containing protein n=1 Tax=Oryza punctata TaxID=4537 RepID=A0A0E0M5Z6_ORYPU